MFVVFSVQLSSSLRFKKLSCVHVCLNVRQLTALSWIVSLDVDCTRSWWRPWIKFCCEWDRIRSLCREKHLKDINAPPWLWNTKKKRYRSGEKERDKGGRERERETSLDEQVPQIFWLSLISQNGNLARDDINWIELNSIAKQPFTSLFSFSSKILLFSYRVHIIRSWMFEKCNVFRFTRGQ